MKELSYKSPALDHGKQFLLIKSGEEQPKHVQYGQCMCNARAQTYAGHVHEYNRVWQIYKPDRTLL